jgi:hypothetical protein
MPRSLQSLTVCSNRGHINPRANTFSTDFVRQSKSGPTPIGDSEIVSAALEILAKRIAKGSTIQNMEDAKKSYIAVEMN